MSYSLTLPSMLVKKMHENTYEYQTHIVKASHSSNGDGLSGYLLLLVQLPPHGV
jgi:hypothetical protein